MTGSEGRRSGSGGSGVITLDEKTLRRLEKQHAEGLTAAQIVEAFTAQSVRLSEATFRKWVQLGLLPRSRRVGRKGKHQGSRGLYPPTTLRRINQIKRLMAENLTIEEIGQSLQFRDDIENVARGLDELFERFGSAPALAAEFGDRQESSRLVAEARTLADELIRRLEILERHIVTPLERAAKQRAFGAGSSGGAGDLL